MLDVYEGDSSDDKDSSEDEDDISSGASMVVQISGLLKAEAADCG